MKIGRLHRPTPKRDGQNDTHPWLVSSSSGAGGLSPAMGAKGVEGSMRPPQGQQVRTQPPADQQRMEQA